MPLLQVRNLTKSFGTRVLFEGVSFEIHEHDRVGLIGQNGCGKTTLLSILMKEQDYDAGSISYSRDCVVQSIDQKLTDDPEHSVYDITLSVFSDLIDAERNLESIAERIRRGEPAEKLAERQFRIQEYYESNGGLTYRSRVRSTLLGLGFSEDDLGRKACELSGGETRKAQLAKILLSGANLLILDEPTNHLDLFATGWLEEFLRNYTGSYIVVSHDRYFLDRVTDRTAEMAQNTVTVSNGNYSRFMEMKSDRQKVLERNYSKTIREIHRLESVIEQQRRWNQARNYITIASKQKQIDRLRETLVKPPEEEKQISFLFRVEEPVCGEVLTASGLTKSFGDRLLFRDVTFAVKKGEHVCLIGPNGCGKTTLLRILLGLEQADAGICGPGPGVRTGYFEQNVQTVTGNRTLVEEISGSFPRLDTGRIRNMLAKFLFVGDDVFKPVSSLSGGEYARIQLLKLMLGNNNALVLDEPTNYLDIPSREQMEDALDEYQGALLVVTHDRYLIERIADRILILEANGIREFEGDWDAYLAEDRAYSKRSGRQAEKQERAGQTNQYLVSKQKRSEAARLRGLLKKTETRIQELESDISALQGRYSDPEIASDYAELAEISDRIQKKSAELEQLYGTLLETDAKLSKNGVE